MIATLVSIAFWIIFTALGLATALFLVGAVIRSHQLSTARCVLDDGSDDPRTASFKLYELWLKSEMLAICCYAMSVPFFASAALVFAGSTVLASAAALALAAASLIAADSVRRRHDRLETEFRSLSGRTVQEVYAQVIDASSRAAHPASLEQSAPVN